MTDNYTTNPPQFGTPEEQWRERLAADLAASHPAERKTATAALVCGIIGVVAGLIPFTFWLAAILGLIALILGVTGWRDTPRRKLARAGTVLGAASIVLAVVGYVIVANAFKELDHDLSCLSSEQVNNPDCD